MADVALLLEVVFYLPSSEASLFRWAPTVASVRESVASLVEVAAATAAGLSEASSSVAKVSTVIGS